ncbi:hypothetical protein MesoLj131b_73400 (plasmid) [Mesorhizobium sp. 131-2-5]|nr:hypothetical protein MesoLj131b_73400 [Mesorhizobium sp. 131-2-5]
MAAIGIVEKEAAPPAIIPALRQVMTTWAALVAPLKNRTGSAPHHVPNRKAFRTRFCVVPRDTDLGLTD